MLKDILAIIGAVWLLIACSATVVAVLMVPPTIRRRRRWTGI